MTNDLQLSQAIEDLLVAKNLRGMKTIQPALTPGYYARAARLIEQARGTVLIGTGFPVVDTYETDGPVGAIALYRAIEKLGATPVLVCGAPLANVIADDYRVHQISVGNPRVEDDEARSALAKYQPALIISIERPGQATDGNYYNMRGENISPRCARFDAFMKLATCPTIAIGDGGNEIGMGNIIDALQQLAIQASTTLCDELVIADVSNWAAHGLIALLSVWRSEDMLADWNNRAVLEYLSARGSVDGVTRENTLTEDSLPSSEGEALILQLRKICGFVS